MQAFVMSDLGVGGVATVPDPSPGTGEALLAPVFSGLCGTDIHLFREGTMLDRNALPLVLGHEFVAEVVDARGLRTIDGIPLEPGSLVAAEPVLPCGACVQCARGRFNLCADWTHLGITRNGSWAELVVAPAARLTHVPQGISAREAALAEPLACAVNFILDRGGLRAGQSVLVLGAGPVGLLAAAVARAAGAAAVVVSEPQPGRRERAHAIGADLVVDPIGEDLSTAVSEFTRGAGVDLIVEITGAAAAVAQAIVLARPGTRVVLAGLGNCDPVPVDVNQVALKELEVRGGFASRWAMSRGLNLLARGTVGVESIITSERSWAEAITAMDDMRSDPDTCKIVLSAPES